MGEVSWIEADLPRHTCAAAARRSATRATSERPARPCRAREPTPFRSRLRYQTRFFEPQGAPGSGMYAMSWKLHYHGLPETTKIKPFLPFFTLFGPVRPI